MNEKPRADGRGRDELRAIRITKGVSAYAEGSALVEFGATKVLITASVLKETPAWLMQSGRGWITAEYGMLPRATHTRTNREAVQGKQSGRTLEIQRLIGRALRQACALEAIAGLTIRLDCDVITADGGTRTAAISGGWVALSQALEWCRLNNLTGEVAVNRIAAVSVGLVDGVPLLDLDYREDSTADFDLNLVMNDRSELIEIQGTAERRGAGAAVLGELLDLGRNGIEQIFRIQEGALS